MGHYIQIEIAGQMVNELSVKFSVPILVICDSWFGNKSLAKKLGVNFGKMLHILTRLRIDSRLGKPDKRLAYFIKFCIGP